MKKKAFTKGLEVDRRNNRNVLSSKEERNSNVPGQILPAFLFQPI